VYNNTVAWNANGIVVLEQNRGSTAYNAFGDYVHDNTIVAPVQQPGGIVYALAWAADDGAGMFDPARGNHGLSNKYGFSGSPEPNGYRWAWNGSYTILSQFNATPGDGGNGVYLNIDQQNQALTAAGIPTSP